LKVGLALGLRAGMFGRLRTASWARASPASVLPSGGGERLGGGPIPGRRMPGGIGIPGIGIPGIGTPPPTLPRAPGRPGTPPGGIGMPGIGIPMPPRAFMR
jgi:hypothetical protein